MIEKKKQHKENEKGRKKGMKMTCTWWDLYLCTIIIHECIAYSTHSIAAAKKSRILYVHYGSVCCWVDESYIIIITMMIHRYILCYFSCSSYCLCVYKVDWVKVVSFFYHSFYVYFEIMQWFLFSLQFTIHFYVCHI